jgi:hypothetical protein
MLLSCSGIPSRETDSNLGSTSVESCPERGSGEKKGVRTGRGAGESLSEEDCEWDELEN